MIDVTKEYEKLKETDFYLSLGVPKRIYSQYKLYGGLMFHDLFDHWLHGLKEEYLFFPVTEEGEYLANTNGAARSYVYAEMNSAEVHYAGLYNEIELYTDTFNSCVEYWRSHPELVLEYYRRLK